MEKYYIYYHCDQWKTWDSMRVVGVFDETTLRETIVEDLVNEDIEFDDRSAHEIKSLDIKTVSDLITFGHIESITLNERC